MRWTNRILKLLAILILSFVFFLALLFRSDISAEEAIEKYRTPQSHFIEVDGVNVHVRFLGEGDPIFLLHGSFSSLHTWEVWQQELSPYFMTISLDFPGHGLTGPDELKRYSVEDYSHLVLSLAEKLNLPKFHLAGNSMGGAVALQIASDSPEKVLSLNLIDASGAPRRENRSVDSTQNQQRGGGAWIFKVASNPVFSKILLKCTPKFLFAMNMKEVYGDDEKVTDQAVTRYYELLLREGNRQATIDRLTQPRSSSINFDRLTMPTLILWGAKDTWIPLAQGRALEKAIPGANLVVFEEAGHVPMEEIPTESVAEYLSFLGVEVRKNYLEPPKHVAYAD
ncbi:alpha/beta fold hydrolase [Algoriphagus sp. AK58]|uniref:alpha/beta fold hydrolase n=1 Tax=Algoriphagus sp. AK58 TaxID=1406877 RepID=UPI00164EF884|nr:alpha/beta hydrolase [Algoriphagus sp. AK58]MBC6365981.1 alpha/beta hydrolase [Algoriphagus sp. AK58]